MIEQWLEFIWLVPLLPLLAAGYLALGYIAGYNRGEAGEGQTAAVALGAAALSLLLMLVVDVAALWHGAPGQVVLGSWFGSGDYRINFSFDLDALGLVMTTLVAAITLLTLRFSVNYMHREAGFQRFFMVLSLFASAMLLIVLAGNAVLMFVGWELAGVSSYLLIGYAVERPGATANATRAFVTNRVGDAGFILGIFFLYLWLGGVEWSTVASGSMQLSSLDAGLIVGAFLLAALAKSGAVPFAPWIARALEGPTPSSAIFYGSLMVHAGVYLVLRLQPLFEQVPAMMLLLAIIGAVTALYGLIATWVQTDMKSALMFSTTAQVGLMFLECGLGLFELAAWHLVLHAIWRAYHFLNAPALMHLMAMPTRGVPAWLARRQWLYTTALHRFWLDHLTDWLFTKPTRSLARDVEEFDEHIVNRMVGLPVSASAISSLAQWDAERRSGSMVEGDSGIVAHGRGLLGRFMGWLASLLYWFEERLVLRGGSEGLLAAIEHLGVYVKQVEELLSRPRYLLLLIMATLVVII